MQKIYRSHAEISFKLHDSIITAVSKRIKDLKIVRNEYFHAIKDNVPNDSFPDICERIKKEKKSLSASVVERQNSKYQRNNISKINHHRQNRRFRCSKRRNHNREWKAIQWSLSKADTYGTEVFARFREVSALERFELKSSQI